jgi:hypothetical protein
MHQHDSLAADRHNTDDDDYKCDPHKSQPPSISRITQIQMPMRFVPGYTAGGLPTSKQH